MVSYIQLERLEYHFESMLSKNGMEMKQELHSLWPTDAIVPNLFLFNSISNSIDIDQWIPGVKLQMRPNRNFFIEWFQSKQK